MVNIGIIGCGGMGNLHTEILKKMKDVKVVAASDVNEESLNKFCEKHNIEKKFLDYKQLLKIDKIDAIICSTPTHTHCEIVVNSAKAKKHIFCEKPISLTLSQADKMINEIEKNDVKFQIGYVRRFDEEWVKFKEIIESNIIGRPVIWRQISAGSGPIPEWFYDIKKGAGPFIDGAVHSYDFAIYTFGKVKKVKSSLTKFKKFSSPDTGNVCVEFESGDILVYFTSWGLGEKTYSNSLFDTIGPEGVLIWAGYRDENNKWFILRKNGKEEKIGPIQLNSLMIGFEKQLVYFIDCIKNNKKPVPGAIEGKESLEVGIKAVKEWKKNV